MADQSFESLLQELAVAHRREQSKLEALRGENEALRAQLKKLPALPPPASPLARPLVKPFGCLGPALLRCLPHVNGTETGLAREVSCVRRTTQKSTMSSTVTLRTYRTAADHFVGLWADDSGEFFGGSAVQFWVTGWRPLAPKPEGKSAYCVQSISSDRWELMEEDMEAGSVRHYVVETHNELDQLEVLCAETGEAWTLDRVEWGADDGTPALWSEWTVEGEQQLSALDNEDVRHFQVEVLTGEPMLQEQTGWLSKLVMSPTCVRRMVWDVLSSFMVLYDVFGVPLMVFDNFDAEDILRDTDGPALFMGWVTTVFWSFDLCVAFFTGYHRKGVLEMRPSRTACHYAKTWFTFDLLVLLPDWVFLTFPTGQIVGLLRVTKGIRFMRILRAIRLFRFIRLQRILNDVLDMVNSETLRSFLNIFLLIGFIICINHYLACGWFLIGRLGVAGNRPSWMDGVLSVDEALYGYVTSLHWTLTQFTPASMDVHAKNVAERVYTICVMLFAMVTFSSFLASITSAVSHLRHSKSEQLQQKYLFRRYLAENRLSGELGNRIWSFLKKYHFSKKRLRRDDVKVLRLLPLSLKQELCNALYLRDVVRLPVLKHLSGACDKFSSKVCLYVSERSFTREEDVFPAGASAERFWILITGRSTYFYQDDRFELESPGTCICEQVLWLQWTHCGQLVARTTCEFLTLDSKQFRTVVVNTARPYVRHFAQVYAARFSKHLKSFGHLWQTDISCDHSILQGLVKYADMEVQEMQRKQSTRRTRSRRRLAS